MARGVRPASEYATSVVRLFPDYAGTVIWFIGPIAYGETRLDAGLVADLQAWEASYYAGLTSDYSWRSPDVEAHFNKLGAGLARRLADQIGDQFQVQYAFDEAHRRVRAAGPARNPKAAAAFQQLADQARAEWTQLRDDADRAWSTRDPSGPTIRSSSTKECARGPVFADRRAKHAERPSCGASKTLSASMSDCPRTQAGAPTSPAAK